MTSLEGEAYSKQSFAYLYRSTYEPTCASSLRLARLAPLAAPLGRVPHAGLILCQVTIFACNSGPPLTRLLIIPVPGDGTNDRSPRFLVREWGNVWEISK